MIRPIDVSSREAYLEWVQEWKGWWKSIVKEIRFHKTCKIRYRDTARRYHNPNEWRHDARIRMNVHHWQRQRLGEQARILHEMRMEGKRLSQEAKKKKLAGE